jgi:hypothetical protein
MGYWFDVEVPYALFLADGGQGEPTINGLGTGDLNNVLLPCVFAIFAA